MKEFKGEPKQMTGAWAAAAQEVHKEEMQKMGGGMPSGMPGGGMGAANPMGAAPQAPG